VFAYEELGAYRYVLTAEGSVRDRYQDRLIRLVEYEKRRGTELLGTLEAYLEHLGSISATARALHMHPNTLRQRLARIQHLTQLDLSREDWLSLGMAIKVVKLRAIRGPRPRPLPDR
jgi:DNA-binding PucR family transcriptional regulator